MRNATESFELPCPPEQFWRVYLDPEYVRALYLGALGYRACEVLEVTDSSRKLRVVPKMNLPRPIESLLGDGFAYEDHGSLDRAKNEWTWRMVQPKELDPRAKPRRDVVTTRGTIRVTATGEGRSRRTDELVIEAKLFGVGGMIEAVAEKESRAAWAKERALLATWLAERR